MKHRAAIVGLLAVFASAVSLADDRKPDSARDILVTVLDHGARTISTGVNAPYRKRKSYATETKAGLTAAEIADKYALHEVDRWSIGSLSVLCIVYRVADGANRDRVIDSLRNDPRVESAQLLYEFESLTTQTPEYDDTYTGLQRGLVVMDIPAAHEYSRGRGVRVAIIDSDADAEHEDLKGRMKKIRSVLSAGDMQDANHGTAVASVIGATANNARGMVGIAPESVMELYVACWAEAGTEHAVCDSFTLAKALDEIINNPPDVLNLSLSGPYDPLVARLLHEADRAGIIAVAARGPDDSENRQFPASLPRVIGVDSSDVRPGDVVPVAVGDAAPAGIFAPGDQILVAVPRNRYDFRSGSSLAAAQVSGIVALLLAVSPHLSFEAIQAALQTSQRVSDTRLLSVNACIVLQQTDQTRTCPESGQQDYQQLSHLSRIDP